MFLFSCCTEVNNNEGYEIRAKSTKQGEFSVLKSLDNGKKPIDAGTQVLKVKKSQYRELIKQYKGSQEMWQDMQFMPSEQSLGQIEGIKVTEWKRLSKIITNPVLFDGRIQPQDAIQGSLGDCYFLSAVSALAEKEQRIKSIFGQQEGIKNGIYRVLLRINGIIEEILVDDYVPVNLKGKPIFCQPNKHQIWVPILEKAWAKANGSYANIVAGCPSQIFRAATYAPAQMMETVPENKDQVQNLWRVIYQNARLNRPCCCGTDDAAEINWNQIGLVPGHAYTLIDAVELQTRERNKVRMLKLRNPWGNTEWEGEGCEKDKAFWDKVVPNQDRSSFLRGQTVNNDGIFYIRFRDYLKYFSQTHFCYMEEQGNYIYDNFCPNPKRGIHYNLTVFERGEYWLQLHQDGIRGDQQDQSALARLTLVVSKNVDDSKGQYEFVDGVLSQFRQDASLKVILNPGKYTIFAKIDANTVQELPLQASVSVYSHFYTVLNEAIGKNINSMLKESFLAHARATKRRKYENQTLWISWKLMYQQGGYAYICFGAQKEAKHKWFVQFNQSDLNSQHFKLKKPFKGKGDGQSFEVKPGEEVIVVARIMNDNPTNLKFPPKLTYKILPSQ